MVAFSIGDVGGLLIDAVKTGGSIGLLLLGVSTYVVFGSPVRAVVIRRAIWRERELQAYAETVLLTRNPSALSAALEKINAPPGEMLSLNPALAHLCIVNPLSPNAPLTSHVFSAHTPIADENQCRYQLPVHVFEHGAAGDDGRHVWVVLHWRASHQTLIRLLETTPEQGTRRRRSAAP